MKNALHDRIVRRLKMDPVGLILRTLFREHVSQDLKWPSGADDLTLVGQMVGGMIREYVLGFRLRFQHQMI